MKLRDIAGPVMQVAGVATGQPWLTAAGTAVGGMAQNAASAQAAQRQMDFQAEMSNTSFQRQVRDLQLAGINPMLVTKLGGASTPVGAMPSFVNPGLMASQASSAQQSSAAAEKQAATQEKLSEPQMKQVEAMTEKIKEETKNIPTEGERLRAMVWQIHAMENLLHQQAYTERDKQRMLAATVEKLGQETELLSGSVEAMKALDNLGKQAEALKPIIEIIKMFIGRR